MIGGHQALEVSERRQPLEDTRRRDALHLSLWEGVCATVVLAVTDTFAVPAALSLAAPPFAVALLASLPLCLGSLGQLLFTARGNPARPRRPFVAMGSVAQAALLAVCALAGFTAPETARWLFVLAFIAFGTSGHLVSALWISWLRDLAPGPSRGRLFASRNRVFASVHLAWGLCLGFIAQRFTSATVPWTFFLAVFGVAALSRAISSAILAVQYEPARNEQPPPSVSGARPTRHFVRFCVASSLMQGAVALSGPFFTVWYLTELHFDYLTFVLCNAATLLGTLLFLPIWGRVADRTGHLRLMLLSASLVSVVPIPFIAFQAPIALLVLNFLSGVAWSAYNLSNFNVLLESVRSRRADLEIAWAIAANGLAVAVFGLLGGLIVTHLPRVGGSQLRALFLLSSVMRIAVVWFCFRELRATPGTMSSLHILDGLPGYRSGTNLVRAASRVLRRL